ncbi:MAG: Ig-like domain-containing protein [Candidatus Heimdallarchaeota archaeon]
MKKKTLVFTILLLLLVQAIIVQTSLSSSAFTTKEETYFTQADIQPSTRLISTDAVAGTEIVQSNLFMYGDMETAETNGEPSAFYGRTTGPSTANFSYQDEVHSGSYGGYLSVQGSKQFSNTLSRTRNFRESTSEYSYLDQDIELDFWYNAKKNPDFAQGSESYFYIRFSTNLGNYYIRYYLSRVSGLPANQSSNAYFDIRGPLDSWTNVVRNLTEDFISVFSGPDLSISYAIYLYLCTNSVANPTGDNILLVDDFSVTNGTGFNYFADNGDFEDGDSYPWYNFKSGGGSIELTDTDYTQGSHAFNLTLDCPSGANTNTYGYGDRETYQGWETIPKGFYASAPGDLTYSFDWKYTDDPGSGGDQRAFIYISTLNETFSADFYFMLGDASDTIPFTNESGPGHVLAFMKADGFGVRDTWHEFSLDYYTLLSEFNLTNLVPYYTGYYMEGMNTDGCIMQLLMDDFQIKTYPAYDPGFEADFGYDPSDPIRLWETNNNPIYVNITSDAHSGNYAANITAHTGLTNAICYRETFLPITNNLYFDSYWRLDKITSVGLAYSSIILEISDTKTIYYMLGSNDNLGMYSNTSDYCYYIVENYNQTRTWNNLFRNIQDDVMRAFGSDYAVGGNITGIELKNYASSSAITSTLFDDINFVTDVVGPVLSNLGQTPDPVQYDEPVTIEVGVLDNLGVQLVELYYKIGADPYTSTPMIFSDISHYYEAVIPAADYGTTVYYYVEAQDVNSLITDSGTPYSYVVDDLTLPTLVVEAPSELEDVADQILFNITTAEDLGSGLDYFEITVDGTVAYTGLTFPYTFTWNTTDYTNGDHTIGFYLNDNADNLASTVFLYTIYNAPTNVGAIFSGLVSFGLVVIAASTMIYFSERRKKYLKRR